MRPSNAPRSPQVQYILDRAEREEDEALTGRQRTELTEVREALRRLLAINGERRRRQAEREVGNTTE
jgi:hypothetical protein